MGETGGGGDVEAESVSRQRATKKTEPAPLGPGGHVDANEAQREFEAMKDALEFGTEVMDEVAPVFQVALDTLREAAEYLRNGTAIQPSSLVGQGILKAVAFANGQPLCDEEDCMRQADPEDDFGRCRSCRENAEEPGDDDLSDFYGGGESPGQREERKLREAGGRLP